MASLGLQGAIRGKPVRTTISDKAVPCPLDHVNRQFHALRPNRPLGLGLHLRRNLGGLRLRRLRHRRLRPSHRGLACLRTAHARSSCSMRWGRPSMIGGPPIAAGSYITATAAANTSRSSTLSGWWRRASSLRWVVSATVMTMLSPNDQRSLQGRDHSSTRAMAVIRSRRVRDAGMGGLVQQPAALGAHRQHPAGRSRGTLLRHAGTPCHGGVNSNQMASDEPRAVQLAGSTGGKECGSKPTDSTRQTHHRLHARDYVRACEGSTRKRWFGSPGAPVSRRVARTNCGRTPAWRHGASPRSRAPAHGRH